MKYMNKGAAPAHMGAKNTVYLNSDKYFNDPDCVRDFEDMGYNVEPVDVFGGFVPQDKSLGNLAKNQKAIKQRFEHDTD